ncbi:cryptochrome/photolyase family protein [Aeromicrobium sp.]
MAKTVMWFRRDLRLSDNPALLDAVAAGGDGVVPLFVLDDQLFDKSGTPRQAYLGASLSALAEQIGDLHVVHGKASDEVVRVARAVGADSVHIAADFTPYGSQRDEDVEKALDEHDIALLRTGSYYAVAPGRIRKGDNSPYRVYTPYFKAWLEHGWRPPADRVGEAAWIFPDGRTHPIPDQAPPPGMTVPAAGERAARRRWADYIDADLADYDDVRDLPGVDRTSRMSVHLKWGEIHPRTMLADLADHPGKGADAYRREIAFREFYADVLFHRPDTVDGYYNKSFEAMRYDDPGAVLEAWKNGRTGFPIVDAGMRQLLAEGWMHNRVRMIVASFLVKDLHVEWQHGARHFLDKLVDADIASNQHGWQWVAGCGTDASPYFRIFNPTTQGKKFDAAGDYIRRYVPELAGLDARNIHEPWLLDNPPEGYPPPLVDHAVERLESLSRYDEIRGGIR